MSPWATLENSFFWLTYNTKSFILKMFWKGRIYKFSIQTIDLIDDSQYKEEQYAGYIQTQTKQRSHHTGIHYNYTDKQLASLPIADSRREIDRRKAIAETNGVRLNVGQNTRT